MGSFGDRLRREREMRGVTLDEISASTKIARRHLEALESENFDTLPGGIFNRGFVRSYARFLGIDEEQAVADYNEASGEQSQPEPSFPLDIPEPQPQLNPRRSSLPLLLALLALVIVLGIFWARSKRQPEANENPPASSPTGSPPAATPDVTPASAAPQQPAATEVAAPARTPAPVQSVSPNSPEVVEPAHSPTPAAAEHAFSVTVQAKEEAWITVTADGQTVVSGKTLQAGDRQVVRAGKKIVLVTGNAGGIDVSFNGRSLGPVGNESEIRALTFTPAGLVQ